MCGVEQLEMWLKTFPDVSKSASLDLVDSPLIISPDDLAEIIQALGRNKAQIETIFDDPPTPRASYEYKNKLNNMT